MDGPHRRAWRVPGARLVGLVAALGLLVTVLTLPSAHTAFSARTGTPTNSLTADELRPPSGLVVTQTCSYAPIVLRGSPASTSVSPLVLSPPAGTQAGDVLVAQVAYYGASTITAASGWTRIQVDTSGGIVTSAVYWKVAVAGEPAASFARPSTDSGDMVGGIVGYSGGGEIAPVAAGATGSGQTATSPAMTATATGVVVVHLLTRSAGQPPTPAGTRELWVYTSDSESVTAADESFAGPGAIPQRTSTTSGSTTAWIAQTVVLRPALQQVGATLSWTVTPSSWATGYRLERSAGGAVQSTRTVTPIGAGSATEGPLVNGVGYTFRLWAQHGAWASPAMTTTLTPSC